MVGNNHSKGNKFSEESKAKLSAARMGNTNRLGTTHTDEMKKLISERTSAALKGVPKKTTTCPHCRKTGGAGNMMRYHFDNCKHHLSSNGHHSGISYVALAADIPEIGLVTTS